MSRARPLRPEAGRGAPPPHTEALRVLGPLAGAFGRGKGVLGVPTSDVAADVLVTLGEADARDAESLARALPDPSDVEPGALVVVHPDAPGSRSLAGRLLSALGRHDASIPRARRCTALLLRGYVDVGGGVDKTTGADLAWGRAPARSAPSD